MSKYANLHCHSARGSIRDSVLKLDEYVDRCIELDAAPGLSEHGNLSSSYQFYKECKKKDVKHFVSGIECYYTEDGEDKGKNHHILLMAKDYTGFQNLSKLSTLSFTSHFYKKPRITKQMMKECSEGVICSTACLQGLSQQLLLAGDKDGCNREIEALRGIFKDDFYLELHNHNIPEEEIIRDHFREYGKSNNIKLIATTDTHYLLAENKHLHNLFKQLSYNSIGKENDDGGFSGTGYHVWSYEEMLEKFEKEEVNNTLEILDKCHLEFKFEKYNIAKFKLPNDDFDEYDFLKNQCYESLHKKGLDKNKLYVDRLEEELNLLHLMNLESYMMVVADYLNWANNNDIMTGPARGSSAASLVAYLTNVTRIDPLQYDLPLVRFINPGRSMTYSFFKD